MSSTQKASDAHKPENGETPSQMKHAREVKAKRLDTTVDEEWQVQRWLCINDWYVIITSAIWLGIKVPLVTVLVFLVSLPMCLVARCAGCCLKTPSDEFKGLRCGLLLACSPFVLLYILAAVVSLLLDSLVYYLFSLPFFLMRLLICALSCFCCARVRLCRSYSDIRPHAFGPRIITHVTDLLVALVGQTLRHGAFECAWRCSTMIAFVPWWKYYVIANPWVYNLEERFVTQISTSLQDLTVPEVAATARRIISRTKQEPHVQRKIDAWRFAPHYPYPPPGRNYALGLQAAGGGLTGLFLITHSTHALEVGSTELRDKDFFVLSNSAELPVYRVMLWHNNPYHIFTGFVEAQITTGAPSQLDKRLGGEHPMWIIASRSPMQSNRNGKVGAGFVDRFFDFWLPSFVDELRRLLRDEAYAKEMHEEVVSKDGISRPAGRQQVHSNLPA